MSCWEQDNHGLCGWFFGVLPIYVWGLCPLLSRLLGRLPPARLTLESQDQSLLQDLQLVIPHISLLPCASASSLEFAVGVRCPWWQGKVEREYPGCCAEGRWDPAPGVLPGMLCRALAGCGAQQG